MRQRFERWSGPAWTTLLFLLVAFATASCRPAIPVEAKAEATENPNSGSNRKQGGIRTTGVVKAIRSFRVQAPQITGASGGRLTLTSLVANGAMVKEGDTIAEFDSTAQLDAARDAQARYDDFSFQVKQKAAENTAASESRLFDIKQAEADRDKAILQLTKGPVLSVLDREKNEIKAEAARRKLESLRKIHDYRKSTEGAALRVLELQRERQKLAVQRSESNAETLVLKAKISGMVGLEQRWRGGSVGVAQIGDQLYPGEPLVQIFDPQDMEVEALVGEPDGAALKPGALALVSLDAYSDTTFEARLEKASPVAAAPLGSPIKNFTARFRLLQRDKRLLPDLSAAVIILPAGKQP
jgi:HlyD family secretion protein